MKNGDLIKELQRLPKNMEVCIYDWRQNLADDSGEGSAMGIHSNFEIAVEDSNVPFIALQFINPDYNDDGSINI